MQKKTELIKDLKFCKELMDRLLEYANENYLEERSWQSNHTVIQNDIQRIRRELMNVSHKLDVQ